MNFRWGDTRYVTDYADYRKTDGAMMPYSITRRSGAEELVFTVEKIDRNVGNDTADFDFPRLSGNPLPDIQKLVAELQINADEIETLLDTYSYIQKQTSRAAGKDGVLRETASRPSNSPSIKAIASVGL